MKNINAVFAHEVKNPLAVIRANIDLIKTETQNERFDVILRQIDKIESVVYDYIEANKESENKDKVRIFDLINKIYNDFNSYKENIDFFIIADNKDTCVLADYKKLTIVFFNIIKNSIEAIDKAGKIITQITEDEKNVIVKIKDNGSGIDEENLSKINNGFFTTKQKGSGLGLYICKTIIEQLRGEFKIYNNKKCGCCAEIRLKKAE